MIQNPSDVDKLWFNGFDVWKDTYLNKPLNKTRNNQQSLQTTNEVDRNSKLMEIRNTGFFKEDQNIQKGRNNPITQASTQQQSIESQVSKGPQEMKD